VFTHESFVGCAVLLDQVAIEVGIEIEIFPHKLGHPTTVNTHKSNWVGRVAPTSPSYYAGDFEKGVATVDAFTTVGSLLREIVTTNKKHIDPEHNPCHSRESGNPFFRRWHQRGDSCPRGNGGSQVGIDMADSRSRRGYAKLSRSK